MSFFDSLWGGLKSVGSAIARPAMSFLSSFAPSIGSALGGRLGGSGGAQMGSALGNVISSLAGGSNNNLASGLSGMGQHLAGVGGQDIVNKMPAWMQNTPAGQFGGNAGSRAGSWLGGQAASLLPRGMQHLAPDFKQFGADVGRAGGNLLQRNFGPALSPQAAATMMGQLPAYGGKLIGAKAFNQTPQGRAAAAENMRGFSELPGMANGGHMDGYHYGGYPDAAYLAGMKHRTVAMGKQPPMVAHGGYLDHYADGGYVENPGYMIHGHHVMANQFHPMGNMIPAQFAVGGPMTLQDAVEMLPIA